METTATAHAASGAQTGAQMRAKMARKMAQSILWKLRDMRRRSTRPRIARLPKEVRALKSLLAEAEAAGVVAPARGGGARLRRPR